MHANREAAGYLTDLDFNPAVFVEALCKLACYNRACFLYNITEDS